MTARDDTLELFSATWRRFRGRTKGLTDVEWAWTPVPDDRISVRWRLVHVAGFLREDRNAAWLGVAAIPGDVPAEHTGAATALADVRQAYLHWRRLLADTTDASLSEPVGPVAGPYAASTRYAYVLHVADELVHHTAELALLRDLYAGRP